MTTNRTIKVGELTGALLDYYVAMAGEEWKTAHQHYPTMTLDPTFSGVELRDYPLGPYGQMILTCVLIPRNPMRQDPQPFCPSTYAEHGHHIIDRDWIGLDRPSRGQTVPMWRAIRDNAAPVLGASLRQRVVQAWGETALIASMRAKVASHYGDEVPDIQVAT